MILKLETADSWLPSTTILAPETIVEEHLAAHFGTAYLLFYLIAMASSQTAESPSFYITRGYL